MTTFFLKQSDIRKRWILIDAENAVVGRLAALVSRILRGKTKPDYTPHADCGDNVIIINTSKVLFTGKKMDDKIYYHHTGYPGGIKSTTPKKILCSKRPSEVLRLAIKRMMDDGPMARRRMKNLYLYAGPEHRQTAQQPQAIDISEINAKNKR